MSKFNGDVIKRVNDVLQKLNNNDKDVSSDEITEAINDLLSLKNLAEKREQAEKAKLQAQREAEEERARHIKKVTSLDLPVDFANAFNGDTRVQGVHADSVADGLILSLTNLGKVDIEYIAAVTGEEFKDVIYALKGSIYQNPETWGECFYKGWETAEEYLSGNLVRKFNIAQEANEKYNGYFKDNLEAIKRALPTAVATRDIYVTLGSPWVPADVIDDFIVHLFGRIVQGDAESYKTRHNALTGSWEIPAKSRYSYSVKSYSTYGTTRIAALNILEHTLNMRTIAVYDVIPCITNKSGYKRVINKQETAFAIEKQKKLIEEFQKWVWKDPVRKDRLEDIYCERFGYIKARRFDGSFLTFPNMSPSVQLYPYQKNAVARILFTPNTLLAHDVGSGKTYIMIAAAMELKRMGISPKNVFVVPNNIVGQWKQIFLTMYPAANLLCIEPKNFTLARRNSVLEKIRDNDYDGVIIAYSSFELIPLSKKFYEKQLEEQVIRTREDLKNSRIETPGLRHRLKSLQEELAKLKDKKLPQVYTFFDELNITHLFIDEAHNFKNVPIDTKTTGVLGISPIGSSKCADMLNKVRCVQKNNDGGGVVMATGTPITNSITDVYVLQNYLQSGELALLDLQSFDGWIGMFAESENSFEIDVDTNQFRMATRFSKFHNLPELTAIFSSVADFHSIANDGVLPVFNGYTDVLIGKSVELMRYLSQISRRADAVRHGAVNRTDDNLLKITTDGRKAALDIRLVDDKATFSYQSKAARCADNAYRIYAQTTPIKATQLIFCDVSTPKSTFNLYDEVARLLVGSGIKREEIAYIHEYETESRRNELFEKVRSGDIRILIGSTFKLGMGVNVQDKLIAIHHLDVPWRPADMVQREGRILRQGNTNKEVFIYRYVTEGSFDAYSWQLLESKQRFISELLAGSIAERSRSDIDDCVLNYAEVKALAVGNPVIKRRVETANELSKYVSLREKSVENKEKLRREVHELKADERELRRKIRDAELDNLYLEKSSFLLSKDERVELRQRIFSELCQNEMSTAERVIAEYRGFEVVLPANMLREKSYVWLRRIGNYYVELSETERGVLIRIDNFLDELPALIQKYKERSDFISQRIEAIERELEKTDEYSDRIEYLIKLLERIDEELGVKKK